MRSCDKRKLIIARMQCESTKERRKNKIVKSYLFVYLRSFSVFTDAQMRIIFRTELTMISLSLHTQNSRIWKIKISCWKYRHYEAMFVNYFPKKCITLFISIPTKVELLGKCLKPPCFIPIFEYCEFHIFYLTLQRF